jgi:hypothetical protein
MIKTQNFQRNGKKFLSNGIPVAIAWTTSVDRGPDFRVCLCRRISASRFPRAMRGCAGLISERIQEFNEQIRMRRAGQTSRREYRSAHRGLAMTTIDH